LICLSFCGDIMTGRGIDQIMPHPGEPVLRGQRAYDARQYVLAAEKAHGPIEPPVSCEYIWGELLGELDRAGVDLWVVNLETCITRSDDFSLDKPVLYRMSPENIGCLTAARIDCCCLANNHVLDFGYAGLLETLKTLDAAGIRHAGAGHNATEAQSPAVLTTGAGRVVALAVGSVTSGIPLEWAATEDRPGVNLLADLSEETAQQIGVQIGQAKQPGDVAVVSIHWGANWGYDIPREQTRFAHWLIDEGVDVVHGHSSHHAKGLEVYRDRLILYGCGDFFTDSEGITGYEAFRGDLSLLYVVKIDPSQRGLVEVRLLPMQVQRFRLNPASRVDVEWLAERLNEQVEGLGTGIHLHSDGTMTVRLS
jgi:poly-gamma-glutamate synthesis protein (capsule biosynthesis protein)